MKKQVFNIEQTDYSSPLFAHRTKPQHAKNGLTWRLFDFVINLI